MISVARRIQNENFTNTLQVLRDVQNQSRSEFGITYGIANLYKENVSCTGFMGTDPNERINFARLEGMYPDNEL